MGNDILFLTFFPINKSKNFLFLDADCYINKKLPNFQNHKNNDLSLFYRPHKNQQFLAGNIYFPYTGNRLHFLNSYSEAMQKQFETLEISWGLDQIILNNLVPKYKWKKLKPKLCSFDFSSNAYIWVPKGKTKDSEIFLTSAN